MNVPAAAIRTRDVARAHRLAASVKCGSESFDDHFSVKSVMVATNDAPFDWYRDTAGQRRLN